MIYKYRYLHSCMYIKTILLLSLWLQQIIEQILPETTGSVLFIFNSPDGFEVTRRPNVSFYFI